MPRDRIFALALLCGIAAFLWTLLARSPERPPRGMAFPGTRMADPVRDRKGAEFEVQARNHDPQVWYTVATLRQAANEPDAAREAWQQVVQTASEFGPPRTRALFLLAWAHDKLGDAAAAKAAFETAAAAYETGLAPGSRFQDRYQAWMGLAWCRQKLGDEAGAHQAWDRAMEIIDRTHPSELPVTMMYDRACCLAQRGEPDAAMWCLDHAIAKGFRDFEWAAADEHLIPLRDNPRFQAWIATNR